MISMRIKEILLVSYQPFTYSCLVVWFLGGWTGLASKFDSVMKSSYTKYFSRFFFFLEVQSAHFQAFSFYIEIAIFEHNYISKTINN